MLMLGMVPFTLDRIKIEEKILLEKLGDEYLEYMKKFMKLSLDSIK
jgi:protein-S-isoprenylcysteine O-methyltransferase Ste14